VASSSTVTLPAAQTARDNSQAILMLVIGIGVVVGNDVLIKLAGATVPLGQMLFIRGVLCTVALAAFAAWFGQLRLPRAVVSAPMGLRLFGEVAGTLTYLVGILNMPIGLANAIFQITPLLVTAGSALFLGEQVGWRRWTATAVGFLGALLIIQPGGASFTPFAFLIVACAVFVAMRDLATRRIVDGVPSLLLALLSAVAVMLMGLVMAAGESWHWLQPLEWLYLIGAAVLLSIGYVLMTMAVRIGEMSVVAPFRYTVVLFGLLGGWLVWSEVPNALAVAGIVVVVAAGLYTFMRERARTRRVE
jgi:drug/metabolite transporter (DMT)-like permease